MNIPEGWKLVPVEPTREMLEARWARLGDDWSPQERWEAMLAAAPTPPASIAWPRECEELCKAAEQFKGAVNELWKANNPDELLDGETAMSEEEARELHSERWKALESAIYYMRKRMSAPPATTPPACEACSGRGEVGGFVNAESGYQTDPCHQCATPPAQEVGLPPDVINALRFYANGEHFSIDRAAQEFDTVSGEPCNWLHSQRDEDCTMIEDGSIARAVLQGKKIHGEVESQPVEGEVYGVAPPAQEGLKVEFTKEWCMNMAQLEGDQAIGVGAPAQEDLLHERNELAESIGNAAIKAGIINADAELTGPTLGMLCDDLANKPAQEDEPVAWLYGSQIFNGSRCWEGYEDKVTWLYTRPDNSGLRKAAEKAFDLLDEFQLGPEQYAVLMELRAALEGK